VAQGSGSSASGTGYASTFARAGFETVARRTPPRPIMRHDLNDRVSLTRPLSSVSTAFSEWALLAPTQACGMPGGDVENGAVDAADLIAIRFVVRPRDFDLEVERSAVCRRPRSPGPPPSRFAAVRSSRQAS